jgi:hypothetical protein
VIIDDLDVKGVTVAPPETDAPLLIDSDAVLTLSITLQSFELIRAWNRKILQVSSSVQLLQLHQSPLLNVTRNPLGELATPNPLGLPATKGLNHVLIITRPVSNVKRYHKGGLPTELLMPAAPEKRNVAGVEFKILRIPNAQHAHSHGVPLVKAQHPIPPWGDHNEMRQAFVRPSACLSTLRYVTYTRFGDSKRTSKSAKGKATSISHGALASR